MSDAFDPLNICNNTAGVKVNETKLLREDNPLAWTLSLPDGGGGVTNNPGAKSGDNPPALFDSKPDAGGDIGDLLWDGSLLGADAPAPAAEEVSFEPIGGKMKEYNLNNSDADGDGSSSGEGHFDMGGWNQRLDDPDGADLNADASEDYGVDEKTARMDVNLEGGQNNSRRGLFGGWRSRRNSDTRTAPDSNSGDSGPPESATLAYGEGGITGDMVDDTNNNGETIDEELEAEQKMDNKLRPGDHIYIWQTYGINPRAYQRHAVVFSVTRVNEADPMTLPPPQAPSSQGEAEEQLAFDLGTLHTENEDQSVEVTVVSFYNLNRLHSAQGHPQASGSRNKRSGCKRDFLVDFIGPDGLNRKKPIHKVKYGRKVKKGLLSQKAGVGTALKKDQVGLIMARVQYLLDHPDHMPIHNALSANGECASLWTVTGRWCTLQGASILAITGVGQAGGALLAGGILSNLTLLVPMPGVWGLAGWWWYVPATVAYPFLVPLLVGLGMASLVPLEILRRNRKKWRSITDGLNHDFWSAASEGTKEKYFGVMATAEREAEVRGFFGVREGEAASGAADDARYMPVGSAPGGMEDDEDEDEALAMQQMENRCQKMAGDMKVDLSGRPPSENDSPRQSSGAWGKVMGSFRNIGSGRSEKDGLTETQKFRTTSNFRD